MDGKTLGERVREERLCKGYSADELAKEIEVASRAYIWRVENGMIHPSAGKLMALSDALGVTVWYLVTGNDLPPTDPEGQIPEPRRLIIQKKKPPEKQAIHAFKETAATLKKLAKQNGLSIAELLDQMVEFCLENICPGIEDYKD